MTRTPRADTSASGVGERARAWLLANIAWFDADRWAASLPPLEVPDQPLIELMLLRRMAGVQGVDLADLGERAEGLALEAVRRPSLRRSLAEAGPGAPYALLLLGLLGDAAPSSLRDLAQNTLDRYRHGLTLLRLDFGPTLALELRMAAELGAWRHELPGFVELRGQDAYAHLDPVVLSEQEAYALTHDLMYASEVGAISPPWGEPVGHRLRGVLETLLGATACAGQLDLTAELLVAHALVGGASQRPVRALAWRALAEAQRDDGSVPGPAHRPELIEDAPPEKKDALAFRTCYHTTLVTAMASVTEPSGPVAPPDSVPPEAHLADDLPEHASPDLMGAALVAAARANDVPRLGALVEALRRCEDGDVLAVAGVDARLAALAELAGLEER